jgi:signal peptidase I
MLNKLYNWSSSWTGTVVIVLGIIFFVAQAFMIPSGSMKNTLLIGDMLFVKKFVYGIPVPRIPWFEIPVLPDFKGNGHLIEAEGPKRGDIVVFRYPKNDSVHYVKRAVAVGGDLIAMKDKNLLLHPFEGNEYVKNNYQKEEYLLFDNKLWLINPYRKNHPGIHNDPQVQKKWAQPLSTL